MKKFYPFVIALFFFLNNVHGAVLFSGTQTWSSDGSEPDQSGRLFRNGTQSTWASPKPNPGLFVATPQDYQIVTVNSATFTHIKVSFTMNTSHNLYSAAYSSFTPGDPAANYLADGGISTGLPPSPVEYFFVTATGTNFDINLSSVGGVASLLDGESFLMVEGFVPEPSTTAFLAAGFLLVGAIGRRR